MTALIPNKHYMQTGLHLSGEAGVKKWLPPDKVQNTSGGGDNILMDAIMPFL